MLMITILVYLLLVSLFGGMWMSLFCLFLLEFLSWLFVFLIKKNLSLKYLLVQSGFLFLGLVGVLFSKSVFLLSAIFLKSGMPPFQLWLFNISLFLEKWAFFFFTSLHKLLPLFFFLKVMNLDNLLIVVSIILMTGLMQLQISGVFFLLMVSSLMHFGWLIVATLLCYTVGLIYWGAYSLLMSSFFAGVPLVSAKLTETSQSFSLSFVWLVLSGMPPFTMFWYKASVLMPYLINFMVAFSLVLVSIMSLISYYRSFHLSLSLLNRFSLSFVWLISLMSGLLIW